MLANLTLTLSNLLVLDYLKFSVYRSLFVASWLIGLMTRFHFSLCDVFNISTPFFSLNSFLFSVEKN